MKKFIILILLYLISQISFSQITSYDWLRTMGNYNDDRPIRLYSDNDGKCKLIVETFGSGNLDTLFFTDTSLSGSNNFLIEFNSIGNISSALEIPNLPYSTISDFQHNDIYMYSTLVTWTTVPITYGNTTSNLITTSCDIFVTKQDSAGNPLSMNYFGGTGDDYPSNIVIDNEGNVIISGYYDSPSLNFAGTTIGNSGSEDAFIAKYDSLGNELWIKRIYSTGDDEPMALAVDEYGNIYYVQWALSLNVAGSLLTGNVPSTKSFLLKFDPNGNLLWNKVLQAGTGLTYGPDYVYNLKIDNSNNVIFTGTSSSQTLLLDSDTIWSDVAVMPGYLDNNTFLVKLDSSGTLLWKKYAENVTVTNNSRPTIACDIDDNIYLSFCYGLDTIILDNDTIITATQMQNKAPILAKFSSNGDKEWYNFLGSHRWAIPRIIYIDNTFDIYISGIFDGVATLEFDSLSSPGFYTGTSKDAYILKATQYVPDHTKHFVNLNHGWSIISSFVDPYVSDCDSVFTDVAADMVLMKNEIGQTFWPMYNVNTIGDLQIGEGYLIKMYNFNILEITGIAVVPEWTPVVLLQDWNIIGYLRQNSAAISNMLSGISSNVYIVKNGNGLVYWPMYGINNIIDMNPGEGYQIKMLAADTLLYPAN